MIINLTAITLLALTFLHGAFASAFMPILNNILGSESGLAFSLYFFGISLGQMSIFKFPKLSKGTLNYPIYELLFSISIAFMGYFLTPTGLTLGRFFEGVFAGLSIPLLFSALVKLDQFLTISKRIALFNSIFSIGFVAGTPILETAMKSISISNILYISSITFIIIITFLFFAKLPRNHNQKNILLKDVLNYDQIKDKLIPLFLSKMIYGFMLGTITAYYSAYHHSISLTQIMFMLAISFVSGQVLIVRIEKFYPSKHIVTIAPIVISLLLFFYVKENLIYLLILASIIHSFLLFISYKNLGNSDKGSREFALYNAITDIGMIVGSLLSIQQSYGAFLLIVFSLIPYFLFVYEDSNKVRAEQYLPFVGPLILSKVLKRHKMPLKDSIDTSLSNLSFIKHGNSHCDDLSFFFAGDFCPTLVPSLPSRELGELINTHDFKVLNLEGTQVDQHYNVANKKLNFDIPDDQMTPFLNKADFNLFSFINNHSLDRGQNAFSQTIKKYESKPISLITSEGFVKELKGIKVGFLSVAYASNYFWRKHSKALFIKPEDAINSEHTQSKLLIDRIKKLRTRCDFLILSYHWGYECEYFPSKLQQDLSQKLHEAGVDLLYGHHCHLPQPYSLSKNKLTLFSLGNLASDMPQKDYQQSVCYSVTIKKEFDSVSFTKVEPIFIETSEGEIKILPQEKSIAYQNYFDKLDLV